VTMSDSLPGTHRSAVGRRHFFPDVPDSEWNDWRWQFRHRVTRLDRLAELLPMPNASDPERLGVLREFRMGITPYTLSLIDPADPQDPIARQVVPLADEAHGLSDTFDDPLAEEQFSPVPGITHRYPDRCLMVISNSCAIYCRYCTRKRIMSEDAVPDLQLDRMIEYIASTPVIRDVIVSGGDPLTFATDKLESILARLRAIPHLEIIRIGSRVPGALPMRIDDELTTMLAKYHPLWINVHFNHPHEITPEAARACDLLSRAGIPLNNQAALLRGVNDDEATQRALCTGLMRIRVRPYYLFNCDPIRGASHFRTTIARGVELVETLRGHISGLAVPQFAVDAPGGGGKIPVNPQYLLAYEDGRAMLRNYQGRIYAVHDPADLPPASMPPPKLTGGSVPQPARAEAALIASTWLRHRP
jgi:lysine 2,3-aminomutase